MSLGWQSESALLPSKATPINVDSKSMMSMKALVYKIEQKLSAEGASQDGVYKRKIPSTSSRNLYDKKSYRDEFKNGDEQKAAKKVDKELQGLPSENIEDRVTASLRAKAAIYDQIALGNGINQQLQSSSVISGSGPFLINFNEKRKFSDNDNDDYENSCLNDGERKSNDKVPKYGSVSSTYNSNNSIRMYRNSDNSNDNNYDNNSNSSSSSSSNNNRNNNRNTSQFVSNFSFGTVENKNENENENEEYIEVLDEFGRSKKLKINSKEYDKHKENEKIISAQNYSYDSAQNNMTRNDPRTGVLGSENLSEWAWSTGQNNIECGDWKQDLIEEKNIKSFVSQKVEKEIEHSLQSEHSLNSNESKVKTMWQKTLENSSKIFLNEIHEDSQNNRNNFSEKIASNRLDDRREKLRQKKLLHKNILDAK